MTSSYAGLRNIAVQSEGNLLGKPTIVNFKGVGVTTQFTNGVATVTIPGVDGAIAGPLQLGILRIGPGMSIDVNGVASAGLKRSDNNQILSNIKIGHGEYITGTNQLVIPTIEGELNKGVLVARNAEKTILSLDKATPTVLGGIKVGTGLVSNVDGTVSVDPAGVNAVIPKASPTVLGGIKIGSGLAITEDGVLSVTVNLGGEGQTISTGFGLKIGGTGDLEVDLSVFPIASPTTLGFIKIGTGLSVDVGGTVSVVDPAIATTSSLGVVQIGDGIAITPQGVISTKLATADDVGVVKPGLGLSVNSEGALDISFSSLPLATTSAPGMVIVGSGLKVSSGLLSLDYVPIPASTDVLGVVKIGSGIDVDDEGTISVSINTDNLPYSSKTVRGIVQVGDNIDVTNGVISVTFPEIPTINVASPTVAGIVKVGSGLDIDVDGVLSAELLSLDSLESLLGDGFTRNDVTSKIDVSPVAKSIATTSSLGEVIVGSGLEVDSSGVLTVKSSEIIADGRRVILPDIDSEYNMDVGTPVGLNTSGKIIPVQATTDSPDCVGVLNTGDPIIFTPFNTNHQKVYLLNSGGVRVILQKNIGTTVIPNGNMVDYPTDPLSSFTSWTDIPMMIRDSVTINKLNIPLIYVLNSSLVAVLDESELPISHDYYEPTESIRITSDFDTAIVVRLDLINNIVSCITYDSSPASFNVTGHGTSDVYIVKVIKDGKTGVSIFSRNTVVNSAPKYDITMFGIVDNIDSAKLPSQIGRSLFLSSDSGSMISEPRDGIETVSLPIGVKLSNTSMFVNVQRGIVI
jgi:hypothetical protein